MTGPLDTPVIFNQTSQVEKSREVYKTKELRKEDKKKNRKDGHFQNRSEKKKAQGPVNDKGGIVDVVV